MSHPELDNLLENYFEGISSSEEEARIKELLNDDTTSDYLIEKEMFAAFEKGDPVPEPSIEFESGIMARIDAEEQNIRLAGNRRRLYSVVAVAASLLIVVSSYFVIVQNSRPADTFTDPELAYLQVIETFRIVSDGLNTGKRQMADLVMIDKASESIEIIGKTGSDVAMQLESLGYINRSMKILKETTNPPDETR